ncbi:hypothetical protein BD410DRAFT_846920 [Rickenella mellea]|uniref:CxC2-like cysteine cluster KDZ transposase-associated domain-containing protein n=1 Tax=Rickenella mellea TaxID=50990 RepID=A0A4Y7PG45_9AGAM|nr:hypothetical protein BD410DRAFT_846920 [Rickenella mellea]
MSRARQRATQRVKFYEEPAPKKAKTTEDIEISTHSILHRISNGRIGREVSHRPVAAPPIPQTETECAVEENGLDASGNGDGTGGAVLPETVKVSKPKVHPIAKWLPHRSTFIDELLRHDARPEDPPGSKCRLCQEPGSIRCVDCFGSHLHCAGCTVKSHALSPLHRVEKWNGAFFERTTLHQLGLRVQLGHRGDPCKCPEVTEKPLTVVDASGIHRVSVDYCGCGESVSGFHRRIQLLRARWFPATLDRPSTVITFDALNVFHNLTLQGKTTFYDFYHTLVRLTDNAGLIPIPDCYKLCMRCVLEWRHLHIIKRSGRGHAADGIEATEAGECAVECPACPQPGRNLPNGWQDVGEEDSWLYTLILSIDANFRLKLKDRGIKDPELGSGWAYFVETDPYMGHLDTCEEQAEINTCDSNLHAVDHANSRFSKGYTATGVGSIVCARHTLVRKNGVADLQKGERYVTMDYILLSTLIGVIFTSLLLTYDIACQWSKNLFARMAKFPTFMQLRNAASRVFHAIPKFHLPAHGPRCHSKYSLNYRRGVGRTDGEGVEREWAHINAVATSTREMGPGSRHGTLDDHWGAWNWRKIVGLGPSLCAKLRDAISNQAKHRVLFQEFRSTFSEDLIQQWDGMIAAWNLDNTKPDPYSETENVTTLADVRLELAKEDAVRLEDGQLARHNVTPSAFLYMGLDLEEQQRAIRLRVAAGHAGTVSDDASIQDRRNALKRRIENWRSIQALYMPGVSAIHSNPDDEDLEAGASGEGGELAEHIDLCLPSKVPRMRDVGCLVGLHETELRLRLAQAAGSLTQLRRQLRIYSNLASYKQIQVSGPGQRANTRARNLLKRFREKSDRCAERYRAAHAALVALDPDGVWTTQFHVLRREDVRGPGRGDDVAQSGQSRRRYGAGVGEGHVDMSWIWKVQRGNPEGAEENGTVEISRAEMDEGLRVEYAKSKARIARWDEESNWWLDRRLSRTDTQTDIAAESFCRLWIPVFQKNSLVAPWAADFLTDIRFEEDVEMQVPDEDDV